MVKILIGLILNLILGSFQKIARQVVSEINLTDMTDAGKRSEAFRLIKERSIAEGKFLRDSIINLAIEMIVAQIKK